MIKKNDLEDLVETPEEVVAEEGAEPTPTKQDWSEYVLDTLKDHELKD